jgi:hypothetical protein
MKGFVLPQMHFKSREITKQRQFLGPESMMDDEVQ